MTPALELEVVATSSRDVVAHGHVREVTRRRVAIGRMSGAA